MPVQSVLCISTQVFSSFLSVVCMITNCILGVYQNIYLLVCCP